MYTYWFLGVVLLCVQDCELLVFTLLSFEDHRILQLESYMLFIQSGLTLRLNDNEQSCFSVYDFLEHKLCRLCIYISIYTSNDLCNMSAFVNLDELL